MVDLEKLVGEEVELDDGSSGKLEIHDKKKKFYRVGDVVFSEGYVREISYEGEKIILKTR